MDNMNNVNVVEELGTMENKDLQVFDMPKVEALPAVKDNKVASGILLGVAGAGSIALVAWAVFGGIKLGKHIKAKALLNKKAEAAFDDLQDEFLDEEETE